MNLLASIWEMSRCRLVEAREHDLPVVATILAENRAVFPLLGAERDPERLALSVLRHDKLPPNGHSAHEKSFLIRNKSDEELLGLLSVYRGYPTTETLYIGHIFMRPRWQRRGIGREVTGELERRAERAGYREIRVVVGLRNWPALRFWIALRYDRITQIVGDSEYREHTYADIELAKSI
ncbi:MAG: GNAT family N-acetyltransferase [Candidatus Competibacteraceae bacterium]|nr:GNAT family N-acetyltransferase [Candidatus Competibacteraceae bacterium]MCB1822259.1 GNAT family N-acetyltransferase [Candidatus Competibacteraceae bacterium]